MEKKTQKDSIVAVKDNYLVVKALEKLIEEVTDSCKIELLKDILDNDEGKYQSNNGLGTIRADHIHEKTVQDAVAACEKAIAKKTKELELLKALDPKMINTPAGRKLVAVTSDTAKEKARELLGNLYTSLASND